MKGRGNPAFRAVWTSKGLIALGLLLFVIFQFVAPQTSTIRLAAYKLMLALAGAVIGHVVVKSLYPYMSLSEMLADDHPNEVPDAIKFAGMCLLRAVVMGAIIVGVLLGV